MIHHERLIPVPYFCPPSLLNLEIVVNKLLSPNKSENMEILTYLNEE